MQSTSSRTTPIPLIDSLARACAKALSRTTAVEDAGAFWVSGGQPFWGAWRDPSECGQGSITARLWRVEITVDLGPQKPASNPTY